LQTVLFFFIFAHPCSFSNLNPFGSSAIEPPGMMEKKLRGAFVSQTGSFRQQSALQSVSAVARSRPAFNQSRAARAIHQFEKNIVFLISFLSPAPTPES
jgi:hypothetical protein